MFLVPCFLGCGKPKKADAKKDKPKEEKELPSLAIGGGDTTIYGSAEATEPSFNVRWTAGQFDAAKGTVSAGHLEKPQGEIFQNGKTASTYRADTGDAIRELKRLDMRGDVTLRSADGKNVLKAPAAQYRGDVKLVRATGGVVATGTFGTLSGVPELWATPDLRLIGTPDMVAKTLKIPALVALAATAATGTAKIQNKDYTLTAGENVKVQNTGAGSYRLTQPAPKGSVTVLQVPSRGLTFRFSGTVVVDFVTANKQTVVRHLTTSSPVNVVQTAGGAKNTIDGTGAEYDAKPGAPTADLDVAGRVTIVSAKQGGATTTSKGDRGTALLGAKPTGNENGLRRVVLTGNVSLDSTGGPNGTVTGTGDRLVYEPKADTADVDLTGDVVLTRVSKAGGGTNTVVSRGRQAHAVLDAKPAKDESPMKSATLTGGVTIDVSGENGTFKGTGDKVVYTGEGEGGKAVMTGNLKFSGDAPDYLVDMRNVEVATVTIGKNGWETVETAGRPTETTIKTKQPPAVKPAKTDKKKGGKKP